METKLLPCPFCPDGGEPKISHHSYELEYGARVYCRRCNTSGPEIHESMPPEDVEALAIEAWNARYERTCEVVYEENMCPCCGECGSVLYSESGYCPSCGSRIKEDTDAD